MAAKLLSGSAAPKGSGDSHARKHTTCRCVVAAKFGDCHTIYACSPEQILWTTPSSRRSAFSFAKIVTYVVTPTIMLLLLCAAVLQLRKEHPHEIYAIWYIFFLFFLIFFALYLYAEAHQQKITQILGPSFESALKAVYTTLTELDDELLLVGAVLYLGIAPQLLTYLFSGLYRHRFEKPAKSARRFIRKPI